MGWIKCFTCNGIMHTSLLPRVVCNKCLKYAQDNEETDMISNLELEFQYDKIRLSNGNEMSIKSIIKEIYKSGYENGTQKGYDEGYNKGFEVCENRMKNV